MTDRAGDRRAADGASVNPEQLELKGPVPDARGDADPVAVCDQVQDREIFREPAEACMS
jgi:hypothetical protein